MNVIRKWYEDGTVFLHFENIIGPPVTEIDEVEHILGVIMA